MKNSQDFSSKKEMCYCFDISGLFQTIVISHQEEDSSTRSLKAVCFTLRVDYSIKLKDNNENIKTLLEKLNHGYFYEIFVEFQDDWFSLSNKSYLHK